MKVRTAAMNEPCLHERHRRETAGLYVMSPVGDMSILSGGTKENDLFNCDYNEGAHERIIKRLVETNLEQTTGYGGDDYCRQAAEMILKM